jgi:hypothetical protein
MTKEVKAPFEVTIYDTAPVEVTNPFSGESIVLTPLEVGVYDVIMGANMTGRYDLVRKGCEWFRKVNAQAYMVLLD